MSTLHEKGLHDKGLSSSWLYGGVVHAIRHFSSSWFFREKVLNINVMIRWHTCERFVTLCQMTKLAQNDLEMFQIRQTSLIMEFRDRQRFQNPLGIFGIEDFVWTNHVTKYAGEIQNFYAWCHFVAHIE